MAYALVLDDDDAIREAVSEIVAQCGFEPYTAATVAQAREIVEQRPLDLALIDLELPDGSGLDLLPLLDELPRVDVVVISGKATVDIAVKAFRSGVIDLMTKPVQPTQLREFLSKARRTAALYDEVRKLRDQLRSLGRFGRIVGQSEPMQKVYDLIAKVAPTDSTVFIIGDTGTGKELVAATIHDLSKRADQPYLTVNCGAIQSNLVESELFGHEKGAFTGADRLHRGLFERAGGGTIFLDEITEMPVGLQVKLLRVLETGEYRRVGGERLLRAEARILAATNRDPEQAAKDEVLREDLMYRLLVFPLRLPPLAERGSDIVLLAKHFLRELNNAHGTRKRLSEEVLAELASRDWPGNVRELKNAIDRAYILADDEVEQGDLSTPQIRSAGTPETALGIRVGDSIAEAERKLIEATLESTGNKKTAAQILGISLKTLYARLNRYKGSV